MAAEGAEIPGSEGALVGRVLGGTYRITRVLDRGGMGTVFEGEHVRLHRAVAVKVLARQLTEDPSAVARFQREAEIVSQLQHPNIVNILDYDTTPEGEPYIVMELLHGESLAERLARRDTLALPELVRIVGQVASALSTAHHASIVHRDLKPANVFLVHVEGGPPFVKLLDFGISKSAAQNRRVTREFDVLGTPDYMAPEQALGRTAQVDHRGDQFALAVIAYEILTGQVPFHGESVASVLYRVAHTAPPPASHFAPQVPPEIDRVLSRAMAKDPDDRYKGILQFATALGDAAGVAVPSIGTLPTEPPPPPPRRDSHLRASFAPTEEPHRAVDVVSEAHIEESADGVVSVRYEIEPAPTTRPANGNPRPAQPRSDPPEPDYDTELEATGVRARRTPRVAYSPAAPTLDRPSSEPSVPDRASSPGEKRRPSQPPLDQVKEAIKHARQSLGFEQLDLAVDYAQSALRIAGNGQSDEVQSVIDAAAPLFERIFVAKLGGLGRRVSIRNVPSRDRNQLAPDEAFLLSRIWEGDTVEQVLDLASLPRSQALRVLVSLLREEIIQTE